MADVEQLTQSALLGAALDEGPALVFVADDLMRYVAVNRTACRTLGYTREELLQRRVHDVAREATAPAEYYEMVAQGFRQGLAVLTAKDGSELPFAYSAEKTEVGGRELYVSVGFAGAPTV
jgi:PAS domain S-box-containing protein